MDLTEVAPVYDVRDMTCYFANLVLFEMVALLLDAERAAAPVKAASPVEALVT
jgi:hypothetical protein